MFFGSKRSGAGASAGAGSTSSGPKKAKGSVGGSSGGGGSGDKPSWEEYVTPFRIYQGAVCYLHADGVYTPLPADPCPHCGGGHI